MKTKILLSFLAISGFAANAQNNNPYEAFGYKTKVTYGETKEDYLRVSNSKTTDKVKFVVFNFSKGNVHLLDEKDSVLQVMNIDNEKLLRWLSTDPLSSKYPSTSPYAFCYGNPIGVVDPDGREGIVVSGQPGDHKGREHFLKNGLDRAQGMANQFKKDGNGEQATWLIYNGGGKGGYDAETIKKYTALAGKSGITVQVVTSASDIVNYVNEKNGGDSRANDLVSKFAYVGHATPGDLEVGFVDHSFLNLLTADKVEPSDFNSNAFKSGSDINVVGGCRTAIDGDFMGEKSVMEQFAGKVDSKSTISGSDVRVGYMGGVRSDNQLVKYKGTDGNQVNGNVVKISGNKDE